MREESNWFSKWEDELPSPDELMPLSQTLITPHLALAFDIGAPHAAGGGPPTSISLLRHPHHQQPHPYSSELDSSSAEICGGFGGGGGSDQEPARTLKRPRLVWTPQLHKRFVDAVAHLGIKNAVPKTIMQLMSVDGLTRENVASHLQKYRLYLKRMQGHNNGGGGPGSGGGGDSATDHLFASSPVPAHFLNRAGPGGGRPISEQFVPYMPLALQHQQMAAVVAAAASQGQGQGHQGQYHQRQMGQFEQNPFLGPTIRNGIGQNSGYHVEDLESNPVNGRKVLTLFPNGND